jgi:hypothetical protein
LEKYKLDYLIEECECDPNKGQKGKRSFSDRTELDSTKRFESFMKEAEVNTPSCHYLRTVILVFPYF